MFIFQVCSTIKPNDKSSNDTSSRNRTIHDVFNDRVQLREEEKKRQQAEYDKKLKEHAFKKKKKVKHYLMSQQK